MKRNMLLSLTFSLLCGIVSGQRLIRVNNDPGAGAHYASLQEAHDNAVSGDTIYLEGSATSYSGYTIRKKLTIIGPGYFLHENDSTQAFGLDANVSSIGLDTGSSGSMIIGVNVNTIIIYTDSITVARCLVGSSITFAAKITNIMILQSHVYQIRCNTNGVISNSIFSNNIVVNSISVSVQSGSLQVLNNILVGNGSMNVYNSSIANNIICHTGGRIIENTGNNIRNNLFAGEGTNVNSNQYNVSMDDVFVDFDGKLGYSTDGKWQLRNGSPAIGVGVGGVDCGAFGGATPYVLSGLPPLPHIYEASIPGTAYSEQGMECTIKIKAGK
jgi:hypothetical protein